MIKDMKRSMTPTSTSESPVFAKRKSCGDLPETEKTLSWWFAACYFCKVKPR